MHSSWCDAFANHGVRINRVAVLQFAFQILSKPRVLFAGTAPCSALLCPICLYSCALSSAGSVSPRKKNPQSKWCANQRCSIFKLCWKMGAKENLNGKASCMCPRVPCLLKLFGTFFFSLAVSLISSRQAVWSGLKAFIKLSPGLINTHFLLEILAQTHQRLLVIRWWHSEQPWLKHGHSSIQYSLVESMYIKETACHHFILESEDYCYTLQTRSLFLFLHSLSLTLCLIFFFILFELFTDHAQCMYLHYTGSRV